MDSNLPASPVPHGPTTNVQLNVQMADAAVGFDAVTVVRSEFSADVLLQAIIIVPGGKMQEGQLVEAVAPFWFEFIERMTKDPSIAFQLSPRQWEEMIAGAYSKAGYEEVILTRRSGDYGRDVIAVKKGICEVRIIDQVKAYKPGHLVDANDVRALMGILPSDGASKGCLTTTSGFAPLLRDDPLIKPFIPRQLELVDGPLLRERLKVLARKP